MATPVVAAAAAGKRFPPTKQFAQAGQGRYAPALFFSSMPARFFTVAEANRLLAQIRPLMGELLERRDRAVTISQQMDNFWGPPHSDRGNLSASQLALEFGRIEALMKQLEGYGCVIKDLNGGLLDFLAEINGREVYLCWRYNEDEIAFYHDLHTGFGGRKPLP